MADNTEAKGDRDSAGRFAPGNRFWEVRSSHGAKPKFENADDLWSACTEYFEWADDSPLQEAKAFSYEGVVTVARLPKMRAMTITGLCNFIDVSRSTWDEWRSSRPDLSDVITRVEAVIYQQKFEGASAGLLVPQIIARDLGLADKTEHTGKDGGPIQTEEVSARDILADRLSGIASRGGTGGNTGGTD